MADLDMLADQLADIAEQLGDASMALLSEAVRSGATKRPDAEKKLAQARRSVDKAVHVLRSLDGSAQDPQDPIED